MSRRACLASLPEKVRWANLNDVTPNPAAQRTRREASSSFASKVPARL